MLRTLAISGLTALAIAISPVNAPDAQAGGNFDKILIGITALAVIGGIAARENKKRRRQEAAQVYRQTPVYETPRHQHKHRKNKYASYGKLRHAHGRYDTHVHHGSRNNHSRILKEVVITKNSRPERCRRQGWGNGGLETYYDYNCVQKYQRVTTVRHYK